ncbi:MAG: hypothetical protein IT410_01950 [Candidatus Doudnabacteria bacterium]|nr:hypothetical protein [Candidatus Doudnabacteria bacterium]
MFVIALIGQVLVEAWHVQAFQCGGVDMHTGSEKQGNRVELVMVGGKAVPKIFAEAKGMIPDDERNVKAGGSTSGDLEEKPELKRGLFDDCDSVADCGQKHREEIDALVNQAPAVSPSRATTPLEPKSKNNDSGIADIGMEYWMD